MRLILNLMAFVLILLTGCGGSGGSEVVVALRPDKDPDAMLEERQRLQAALRSSLEREVSVIIPTSGAVVEQGLSNGTIDVAWVSSTSLARYRERGIADLLLVSEVDGKTHYSSYWLSRSGSALDGVESLRGKPIAFASPTSTSGYVIPLHDLAQRGLVDAKGGAEGYFGKGNVHYGTGYLSAVKRVLDGSVVAAAVSDYVYEGDKHLTPSEKEALEIVARQGPVPTHCLAVQSDISGAEQETLMQAFLAIGTEAADLEKRIFSGPLVQVNADEHLRPIEQALAFVRELN
jgi:phosphonate transport system substrate-binding protein